MATKKAKVAEAAKRFFPWYSGEETTAHPGSQKGTLQKGIEKVAFDAAIRLIPLLPDKSLLSIFDRKIKTSAYHDQAEFVEEIILMVKRRLSSPEFKKASVKLMKRVGYQGTMVLAKRREFRETYNCNPPGFLAISPSMRCNLRCVGCYAGEYSQKDDLSSDLLHKVVREAKELGIVFMVVIGGEPFISNDVLQMWEENPEISFIVFTNGTLINEAMAKRIAKMGNVYPAISVEGFEVETDARRGKGTFARVTKAMDNLRREGLLFGFSATAVRSNNEVVSSPEFVDFYVDKGCFMGWYFNYIPIGREPDMSLMPTPEQRISRWRRIRELRKTRPILLADFWCDGILTGGCIAGGKYYMHINNKGDAEPCVFAHFAVDNIKDKTITEIAQSPFFRAIQARQPFSPNLLRPCMVIDNPEVLRSLSVEAGAAPTHQGAETIIGKLAPRLDEYAREYAKVADDVWKEGV